jgi:hypothetical protein
LWKQGAGKQGAGKQGAGKQGAGKQRAGKQRNRIAKTEKQLLFMFAGLIRCSEALAPSFGTLKGRTVSLTLS